MRLGHPRGIKQASVHVASPVRRLLVFAFIGTLYLLSM